MHQPLPDKRCYEFGVFRLDADNRLLMRDGVQVSLTLKSYELLAVLVGSRGNVLEKGALIELVWPDTFVEEANLSHHIYLLRKALGDDRNGNTYIETIPRRGYRFVMAVREVNVDSDGAEKPFSREVDTNVGSNGARRAAGETHGSVTPFLPPPTFDEQPVAAG